MSMLIKAEKETLDIAFITEHCCIRVVKQAIVLKKLGHRVHLIASDPNSVNVFSSVHIYKSPFHLEQVIKSLGPVVDIWQVHNEPSWPAILVREVLPDAKLLIDAHDTNHWRVDDNVTQDLLHEDVAWFMFDSALKVVDGVVVPSRKCQEDIALRTDAPVAVVPSACPMSEFRYQDQSFIGGLVSQGGHASPGEILPGHPEHWRDYTELYSQVRGRRQVFAYSPNFKLDGVEPIDKHYISLGAKIGHLRYDQLLDQVAMHSWNLSGNLGKAKVWDYALPNKFFDAIAAGIPSVSFGTAMVDEIIAEHGIGISCASVDEMIEQWDRRIEIRAVLLKKRRLFAMESYIGTLVDLYKKVLAA